MRNTIDLTEQGLFSGLYESIWLNSDYEPREGYEIKESVDFESYLTAIANAFVSYLTKELGGAWKVDSIWSPNYYNYDTDHIILSWEGDIEVKKWLLELTEDEKKNIELFDIFYGNDDLVDDYICEPIESVA